MIISFGVVFSILFCVFLLVDLVWLFLSAELFYKPLIGHLFADSFKVVPGLIFYLLFACAVTFFVINPYREMPTTLLKLFLTGAFFGLVCYGTYDLTNHATLREWPLAVTVVDMLWGAFVTGFTSVITMMIVNFFEKR